MRLNFLSFSSLTLLVALSLSSVAAYYSIIGLTAIFAGAVIPVIIMGSILEVGKITTTVWLRKYWGRAGWALKLYLVPAVVALALLTSMGIFGFLSKAHMEQGLNIGDVQSKISLYDEKIKTQRDNITVARKALEQMDAQVDQRLTRGVSEQGAERAVVIRRQQQGERNKLQKEIGEAQQQIAILNEQAAPIRVEVRKVEAEVGPIKYIAALIYGNNADQNMLESAVRWVIILLVIVFDPLAIALVLAANASKEWDKEDNQPIIKTDIVDEPLTAQYNEPTISDNVVEDQPDIVIEEPTVEEMVPEPDQIIAAIPEVKPKKKRKPKAEKIEAVVDTATTTDNHMTITTPLPYTELPDDYVSFNGSHMKKDVLRNLHPELFRPTVEHGKEINSSFGTMFPESANRGDLFTRVDTLPNKVFKFDGNRWIAINKETSSAYLLNTKYIEYLIDAIANLRYDPELLSDTERAQIEDYIKINKIAKHI